MLGREPGRRGNIDMTPESIAARAAVTLEQCHDAMQILSSPDENSRSLAHDGRRIILLDENRNWGWKIVNWELYEDQRKKAMATERKRRQRVRERIDDTEDVTLGHDMSRTCHAPVTPSVTPKAKAEASNRLTTTTALCGLEKEPEKQPNEKDDKNWPDWDKIGKALRHVSFPEKELRIILSRVRALFVDDGLTVQDTFARDLVAVSISALNRKSQGQTVCLVSYVLNWTQKAVSTRNPPWIPAEHITQRADKLMQHEYID
jgi:hypothetical protein